VPPYNGRYIFIVTERKESIQAREKTGEILTERPNVTTLTLRHIMNVSLPKKRPRKKNGDWYGLSAFNTQG
jgi:hypothetical protein